MFNVNIQEVSLFISIVAAIVACLAYRGNARLHRLTANERLMQMVININKVAIDYPELGLLTNPDKSPPPKNAQAETRMREYMYMHLNMFDVAFNYYYRTIGISGRLTRPFKSREELDHWSGWVRYLEWFVNIGYVEENYSKEAHRWYGPQFKAFLHTLNNKLSSS